MQILDEKAQRENLLNASCKEEEASRDYNFMLICAAPTKEDSIGKGGKGTNQFPKTEPEVDVEEKLDNEKKKSIINMESLATLRVASRWKTSREPKSKSVRATIKFTFHRNSFLPFSLFSSFHVHLRFELIRNSPDSRT
jgi:hypothetical protein